MQLSVWIPKIGTYGMTIPHAKFYTYTAQITDKIKHESCNSNSCLRKSRLYGNCHFSATIFGIFKQIINFVENP
jgi:hypothetical protein